MSKAVLEYLITTHAEKSAFQKLAEELDVWLLPKYILAAIPLKLD